MGEYYTAYPLCQKYDAPILEGMLRDEDAVVWVKSLPDDWSSKFWEVCGPVTRDERGTYATDIENTLWSLERNKSFRRWDG